MGSCRRHSSQTKERQDNGSSMRGLIRCLHPLVVDEATSERASELARAERIPGLDSTDALDPQVHKRWRPMSLAIIAGSDFPGEQ